MVQLNFPKIQQIYEYDCGAASLLSVLLYYGIEIKEGKIIKYAKTEPREGTSIEGMLRTLEKFKLKYITKKMTIKEIKNYINKKIPVILVLQAWNGKKKNYLKGYADGHWVTAIGYTVNKIIFEDPYSFKRVFLKNQELLKRWRGEDNKEKIHNFGIAIFGKRPCYNPKALVHMN